MTPHRDEATANAECTPSTQSEAQPGRRGPDSVRSSSRSSVAACTLRRAVRAQPRRRRCSTLTQAQPRSPTMMSVSGSAFLPPAERPEGLRGSSRARPLLASSPSGLPLTPIARPAVYTLESDVSGQSSSIGPSPVPRLGSPKLEYGGAEAASSPNFGRLRGAFPAASRGTIVVVSPPPARSPRCRSFGQRRPSSR